MASLTYDCLYVLLGLVLHPLDHILPDYVLRGHLVDFLLAERTLVGHIFDPLGDARLAVSMVT